MEYEHLFEKIVSSKKPGYDINEDDLVDIENNYGFVFPQILKEFYLGYNGASIKELYVSVGYHEFGIHHIFPVRYRWKYEGNTVVPERADKGQLEYFMDMSSDIDSIRANNLVLFADDVGGDEYFWQIGTGTVYLIRFDDVDEPILAFESVEAFFRAFASV